MELLKILIPIITIVGGWLFNEKSKRTWEEYKRKEEHYSELIKNLQGFYVKSQNLDLKAKFLGHINLCWLYCTDEVIKKAYAFLETVHTGQIASDEQKERALGKFILEIRKDLISRKFTKATTLKSGDFKNLHAI